MLHNTDVSLDSLTLKMKALRLPKRRELYATVSQSWGQTSVLILRSATLYSCVIRNTKLSVLHRRQWIVNYDTWLALRLLIVYRIRILGSHVRWNWIFHMFLQFTHTQTHTHTYENRDKNKTPQNLILTIYRPFRKSAVHHLQSSQL